MPRVPGSVKNPHNNNNNKILVFSHLCLYEIGFLSLWETSITYDHASPRNNPLKGGKKKKNSSWASPCRIGKSRQASSLVEIPTPRVRLSYPESTLLKDSYIHYSLLSAVKRLPVLQYCVVYTFWTYVIIELIMTFLKKKYESLMRPNRPKLASLVQKHDPSFVFSFVKKNLLESIYHHYSLCKSCVAAVLHYSVVCIWYLWWGQTGWN